MNRKWNQFLSKRFREADKNDTFDLLNIQKHLKTRYGISTKKEYFFLFNKSTSELVRIKEYVTEHEAYKFKVRCPDLYVYNSKGKLVCVIELDGKVHDVKTERTLKRNSDYMYAEIPMIVINQQDLLEEQKSKIICWKDKLHQGLVREDILRLVFVKGFIYHKL